MKKLQIIAAAAVLGAMSMSAQADSYWAAQYAMYDFDGPAPTGVNLTYGRSLTEAIDGEFYVGMGVGDDDGFEVPLAYGIEVIYPYELSEGLNVYGQVSINYTEFEFESTFPVIGTITVEGDDTTAGFGIGIDKKLGSGSIFAEYRGIDAMDVTSLDIGYKMSF